MWRAIWTSGFLVCLCSAAPQSHALANDREPWRISEGSETVTLFTEEVQRPGIPVMVSEPGGDEDLSRRLEELEQEFRSYRDEVRQNEETTRLKTAAEKQKASEDAKSKPTFKLNGRIHLDYWAFPEASPGIGFFEHSSPLTPEYGQDPEDVFQLRRARLEASGDLPADMFWRLQVEFGVPTAPQVRDVYVGFRNGPFGQQLVIGNQKRPLGLDALNSTRDNIFLERPTINDTFNEDIRRPGILVSGSNRETSFNWAYGVFGLENIQDDGEYRGDPYQLSFNVRLHGSPLYEDDGSHWFHWALAGMFANPDGNHVPGNGTNRNEAHYRARAEARTFSRWLDTGPIQGADFYETAGLEFMYNRGPVHWTGEYMLNWTQRDEVTPGTGPDLFFHGGYIQAAWFITGEHMVYLRDVGQIGRVIPNHSIALGRHCRDCGEPGWGAWQIAARYSFIDLSQHDITGGREKAATFGVNWLWTPYAMLQFNVIHGSIDERGPIGGYDRGQYTMIGTRIAVDF